MKRPVKMRAKKARTKPKPPKATPAEQLPDRGRVLGLDVSSQTVGWAVFDGHALIACGKWHPEGRDKHHGEKLSSFRAWLLAKLEEWRPDHLVTEAPYAGRRRYTFGILSMYLGVTLAAHFAHFGEEIPEANRVMPHAVKRLLKSRKGVSYEQRKKDMVLLINQLYGLTLNYKPRDKGRVSDDDIADAIGLVHAWLDRGKEKDA